MSAVAYIRVSTDQQHLGPEAQRAAIRAWATRVGEGVSAWHEERVSGATPIERRPELLAAIGELRKGDMLVVARRDRLARDVMRAAMIEAMAARRGGRIVSAAGEGTDTDDPGAKMIRQMLDVFAEYERAMICLRTRAALGVLRRKGQRYGEVPYGMQLADDGKTLCPNMAERAIAERMRELRDGGASFRTIERMLREEGVRSRSGEPFRLSQIHRIVGQR